ncbi:hypothetical protein JRO89_XS14G0000900 [Xanthoceras sorbifolium]|uniref:Uncharacterized protein n=1 Tax=Xanthoceras sorbifolium TaxID=99658 RepID=A0ABQ8H2Z6_9ROSI|nr:hypothetical protein JRO89_XS14G0000900 [Xanthoceras sorbifolium]
MWVLYKPQFEMEYFVEYDFFLFCFVWHLCLIRLPGFLMRTNAHLTMKGSEEIKEIRNFWNIIIWATEYCLLPHDVPRGLVASHAYVSESTVDVKILVLCRFLKVMAMVWAGSQVTKLVRAGGALALAPFVDRGLSWFTDKFKFKSQGKASIHGDCWILFWTGSDAIFCCDIAFGMKLFRSSIL